MLHVIFEFTFSFRHWKELSVSLYKLCLQSKNILYVLIENYRSTMKLISK